MRRRGFGSSCPEPRCPYLKPCPVHRYDKDHTKQSNERYGTKEYRRNRKRCLDRDGHRCRKCGTASKLTAHHIIPKWDGGTDDLGNLLTLCHRHNREADDAYKRGGVAPTGSAWD